MMLSNPEGKAVDIVLATKESVLVKEECHCWGNGRIHWNLLLTDRLGECLVATFFDEREIDWVMFSFKAWLGYKQT